MGKKRQLDTDFWSDPWVLDELDPLHKLLFIYLVQNTRTNIAGVYEISMQMIANETGLKKDNLPAMMKKLESRIVYVDGWIILRKAIKYQSYKNPQISAGIIELLRHVPHSIFHYIFFPTNWGSTVMNELDIDETCLKYDETSHLILFNLIKSNTNRIYVEESDDTSPALPIADAPIVTEAKRELSDEEKDHTCTPTRMKFLFDLYVERYKQNPKKVMLTEGRKRKLKARIASCGARMIAEAIVNASIDPWYSGTDPNGNGWKASFDWIIDRDERIEKLANLEGKKAGEKPVDRRVELFRKLRENQDSKRGALP